MSTKEFPVFTIAQFTDPHLSSLNQVSYRQLLNKRLLGYLSWRKRRRYVYTQEVLTALVEDMQQFSVDHTIVSGDLTQVGLPDEFTQVVKWLQELGAAQDITVIPGNHECYAKTDYQQTFAQWKEYMASDEVSSVEELAFPSLRVRGQVAIIGLNSAFASAPLLAVGRIGEQQLTALATHLEWAKQQKLFRLVVVHHPPIPGLCRWRKRLIDADRLQEVLQQCGAELVLFGHTHQSTLQYLQTDSGLLPLASLASASSNDTRWRRRASYALFSLSRTDSGWSLSHQVREYQGVDGEFKEYDGASFLL